jgi:hypothetical protein
MNRPQEIIGSKKRDKDPYSIVMLLRKPHFFSETELEQAGERGWGKRFDGKEDPMYFVSQTGTITFLKAGKYAVHLIHASRPYLDSTPEVMKQLPQPEQRQAWQEHTAWAAFNLLNDDVPKGDAYATLAQFVLQLGDANCSGIHFPEENIMMPNDGTAEQGLRMLIRKELF